MKIIISFLFLLPVIAFAQTLETLKVTDMASLQKCFAIQPYLLKNQKTTELVEQNKIIAECTLRAAQLVKLKKTVPAALKEITESVRKASTTENTLKIYQAVAAQDSTGKICDSMDLYEAIKAGLSHPLDYPSAQHSYVSDALATVDACFKFNQFAAGIKEEAESGNSYVRKNICGYFVAKKIGGTKCK